MGNLSPHRRGRPLSAGAMGFWVLVRNMTSKQLSKLETIIGKLEALQADTGGNGRLSDLLAEAKSKLIAALHANNGGE